MFEKQARKSGWEKTESKIDHPKFILTSAVPGQLRKTIDRISSRATKRLKFKRMLGIKRVFVVRPAPSSTSTHLKFILACFQKKAVKGKGDENSIEK